MQILSSSFSLVNIDEGSRRAAFMQCGPKRLLSRTQASINTTKTKISSFTLRYGTIKNTSKAVRRKQLLGLRSSEAVGATSAVTMASSSEYEALREFKVISAATGEEVALTALWGQEETQKVIVPFLTQFGDFDSFELVQRLRPKLDELKSAGVEVVAVGIGNRAAAQEFCRITQFPPELVYASPDSAPYDALGFAPGFARPSPPALATSRWWNSAWVVKQAEAVRLHPYMKLVIMCAGIGSPGTLPEVFRGYLGDRAAPEVFERYPDAIPPFMKNLFKIIGEGYQRPFELATVRLVNMVNILTRWETLTPQNKELLLQRGGAFVFEGKEVIFRYDDPAILRFVDVEDLVEAAL